MSQVHVPNFLGCQGGRIGDNSIQFINVGRVGDKRFFLRRIVTKSVGVGGRVGDNNI